MAGLLSRKSTWMVPAAVLASAIAPQLATADALKSANRAPALSPLKINAPKFYHPVGGASKACEREYLRSLEALSRDPEILREVETTRLKLGVDQLELSPELNIYPRHRERFTVKPTEVCNDSPTMVPKYNQRCGFVNLGAKHFFQEVRVCGPSYISEWEKDYGCRKTPAPNRDPWAYHHDGDHTYVFPGIQESRLDLSWKQGSLLGAAEQKLDQALTQLEERKDSLVRRSQNEARRGNEKSAEELHSMIDSLNRSKKHYHRFSDSLEVLRAPYPYEPRVRTRIPAGLSSDLKSCSVPKKELIAILVNARTQTNYSQETERAAQNLRKAVGGSIGPAVRAGERVFPATGAVKSSGGAH
jgi:hypothetical protein